MQSNIVACNEFANNVLHLNSEGVLLAANLDIVHKILYMDTSEGREAHARMYHRSDLYFKIVGSKGSGLVRP